MLKLNPLPSADKLCHELADQIRPHLTENTVLVGIHTGGVWLMEKLYSILKPSTPPSAIDVSFYRDDYNARGLHAKPQRSTLPLSIDGAHVILVDDVLYTGRTTRAALNELFDFGRPACVELAVLVDRGGRQLPIAPRYCALTLPTPLPDQQKLRLAQEADGSLNLRLIDA